MNQIVKKVADAYPPYNDYLLLEFREDKVAEMLTYLDSHFRSMRLFNGALTYQSYHVLTPEERVAHLLDKRFAKGAVQIQKSTTFLVRFDFVYAGEVMSFFTELPYIENHAVVLNGSSNYPLFVIMEKVLHRSRNGVFIKVALAPLAFYRSQQLSYKTTQDIVYKDFLPTTSIHWGRGGLARRSANKTPIILYHFCEYGFDATLEKYGLKVGEDIQLVESDLRREGYIYFKIKDSVYLEVKESIMTEKHRRRVVISIICIFTVYPKFSNIAQIRHEHHAYFKLALGYYNYTVDNQALLFKNAADHLDTVRVLVDPAAQYAMSTVGMRCVDAFDLLFQAFHKLDEWLIYNPANLYEKRLGALDQMLSSLLRNITEQQFKVMRHRSELNRETIVRFMRCVPLEWVNCPDLFRDNSSACHDNWLLTIGAKRVRSNEAMETHGSRRNAKGSKGGGTLTMSADIRRAHPSALVVDSILAIPSSKPLIAGTINPYAQIDTDGNIIRPPIADLVEHVFDIGSLEHWEMANVPVDIESDSE